MKFWDSSAILAFIAGQASSVDLAAILSANPDMAIWWGTPVEIISGLCRLRREGRYDDAAFNLLLRTVESIASDADEIEASELVRSATIRLLRTHSLRAADALQLAAALVWVEHNPSGAGFVCLDERLREAAGKEGFEVMPSAGDRLPGVTEA